MRVNIPGPLRSYTRGASRVDVSGGSLDEVLQALDEKYPGIRFRFTDEQDRVRTHIKVFVNTEMVEDLGRELGPADEVTIICALSGG